MPFDLSRVLFITTANDASSIPAPLLNRMELIELGSYTREEKFNIARNHLIKKQTVACGLNKGNLRFSDEAIYKIIDSYTREAGVRRLERTIATICRKSAAKIVSEEAKLVKIIPEVIREMLGNEKYKPDTLAKKDEVGLVNGLAWTSVGGEIMPLEVVCVAGTGQLSLTGSLGDVMQESAKAAVTCVRSRAEMLGIENQFYKNLDIHIHAPEAAIPKDGPSAGVTMFTALVSALCGVNVKHDVAMTGEITLRGKVLPIGGLREKAMAAYKSGIKTVIIPIENIPDLDNVDDIVKENIDFKAVESVDEVLNIALTEIPSKKDVKKEIYNVADSAKDTTRATVHC
jgi:ATP-dependent Lon protease